MHRCIYIHRLLTFGRFKSSLNKTYWQSMLNVPCGGRIQNPIPSLRSCCDIGVTLTVEKFGHFRVDTTSKIAKPVKKFKWVNRNGMIVEAINYGATIISIVVPDRNGHFKDVVLGSDNMEDYLSPANPYFGATIGRACNRIGHGVMVIDGKSYELSKNAPPHMLHGGFKGFDKILWSACREDKKITLSYSSRNGEEGFPGDLNVNIVMYLTDGNEFVMEYRAFTTKPTYVNLTNHTYFNLAGHMTGSEEIYQHKVCINADQVTHVDKQMVPTGKMIQVGGTPFDFRIPKTLKEKIGSEMINGFDHNFCLTLSEYQKNSFVGRVVHPPSGRVLEVYSNQPGVQFYTANHFPEKTEDVLQDRDNGLLGKRDCRYFKHGGFTLEPQNYPDAVNHPEFPPAVLYPGNVYVNTARYIFSVQRDDNFVNLRTSPLASRT